MFFLRDSPSISSSGTDEDSFGWWIGVETNQSEPRSSSPRRRRDSEELSTTTNSTESRTEGELLLVRDLTACTAVRERRPSAAAGEAELIELCSLYSFESEDEERPICYTPERLVRSNEFRILAPSPRNYSALSDLIRESTREEKSGRRYSCCCAIPNSGSSIPRRIGSKLHLETLDQTCPDHQSDSSSRTSSDRCCCIRYGGGEVLLHTELCPAILEHKEIPPKTESAIPPCSPLVHEYYGSCCDSSRLENNENLPKLGNDDGGELADDTCSRVSSVQDASSEISCNRVETNSDDKLTSWVPRHLSDELACVSIEYAVDLSDSSQQVVKGSVDVTEVVSILASLESCDPSKAETVLLAEDRFRAATQTSHDCLARLALSIEPDDRRLPPVKATSQEGELELVRERLERLQDSSQHLLEQIFSLRRDFSRDEWKVDQLSESVSKLRNEVYELRYLDDLLKLLKGELQLISNKEWPFAIRHVRSGTEEINLVV